MISCRKATELIELRQFRTLDRAEQLGLWLHIRLCKACGTYQAQSALIDRLMADRNATLEDTKQLERKILAQIPSE